MQECELSSERRGLAFFKMGGNCSLGVLVDITIVASPQYPVAGWPRNPFTLCDFPLVTLITVLY
jgi:hypothetical protein